jgi:hypothetical protein
LGVVITLLLFLIPYLLSWSLEKKIVPLSVPDSFVPYSNSDFALSFPYTVNQNNAFSSRTYAFVLDESEINPSFLMITVIEGKSLEVDGELNTDEESLRAKESLTKIVAQMGGNAAKVTLSSYEKGFFQGNKSMMMVLEVNFVDVQTQEMKQAKFKMRTFFAKETKKLYQIAYMGATEIEQVLSTLNFQS